MYDCEYSPKTVHTWLSRRVNQFKYFKIMVFYQIMSHLKALDNKYLLEGRKLVLHFRLLKTIDSSYLDTIVMIKPRQATLTLTVYDQNILKKMKIINSKHRQLYFRPLGRNISMLLFSFLTKDSHWRIISRWIKITELFYMLRNGQRN